MSKFRIWIIKLIVGKNTIVMNIHLLSTLSIDTDKCIGHQLYDNVNITTKHSIKIPDSAFYFHRD